MSCGSRIVLFSRFATVRQGGLSKERLFNPAGCTTPRLRDPL